MVKYETFLIYKYQKSHERYFVLDGCVLSYFDKRDGGKEKGRVELGRNSIIQVSKEDDLSLSLIPYPGSNKELFLTTKCKKECEEWKIALVESARQGKEVDEEEQKESDSDSEEEEEEMDSGIALIPVNPKNADAVPEWKTEWMPRVYPKLKLPHMEYQIKKAGIVLKKSTTLDEHWNKRYFVLEKDLFYYDSVEAFESNKACTRIALEGLLVVLPSENPKFEFSIITIGQKFTLRADTQEDMEDWVTLLKEWRKNLVVLNQSFYGGCDPTKKIPGFVEQKANETFGNEEIQTIQAEDELGGEVLIPKNESKQNGTESLRSNETEAQGEVESPPVEDRFAKLRSLREKKISESQ